MPVIVSDTVMPNPEAETTPVTASNRLLFGVLALVFLVHSFWLAGVAEDAFISFRFARNWIDGAGLVWNVGEPPVEGFTNFLWVAISSAGTWLGFDLPLFSQLLGNAAALATLHFTWQCGRLLGWGDRLALIPVLALACSGPFAAWASSGMETSLFGTLTIGAVVFFARYDAKLRARDLHACLLLLLLACLTRPEGLLVSGIVAIAGLVTLRERPDGALRRFVASGAGAAAIFGAYFAWRWVTFGYPLPNTFYAKTGGGFTQFTRGLHYAFLFGLHFVLPWAGVMGLFHLNRPATSIEDEGEALVGRWKNPVLLPLSGALVLVYTFYISAIGGDYMAMYRFFVPILPFLYLLIGAAFVRVQEFESLRPGLWASLVVALLMSLFHSTPLEKAVVAERDWMHGNYRGIEVERWWVARNRLIGQFFARYASPEESIATGAIGAIAYESGLRVYDAHGIVDPHIAHAGRSERGKLGSGLPGHEKTDYPYLFAKQPTFYLFRRRLLPEPFPGIPAISPDVDARVQREYKVGNVWLEDEANGEAGYFAFLERRDRGARRR